MIKVKRFKANTRGRDFIVGDLHGCHDDLLQALKAIGFKTRTDRLFCTGDLTDRGPDSIKAAKLVNKRWFHATRGNHEEMMIDALVHGYSDSWRAWTKNGGDWARDATDEQLKEIVIIVRNLPDIIVVGEGETRFNMVHAELLRTDGNKIVSDVDIDTRNFTDNMLERLHWGRSLFGAVEKNIDHNFHEGLSLTYVGHTAVLKNLRCLQHLFIDGGCCYHYAPPIRKPGDSKENSRLVIACHQDKVLREWHPATKQLSDPIPYDDVLDVVTLLKQKS